MGGGGPCGASRSLFRRNILFPSACSFQHVREVWHVSGLPARRIRSSPMRLSNEGATIDVNRRLVRFLRQTSTPPHAQLSLPEMMRTSKQATTFRQQDVESGGGDVQGAVALATHGVAACHHQRARVDHPLVCTNTCMVAARRAPATTAVSPLPSITRRLCFHASIAPTARRRPRGDLEPHVASSPPSWPARKPPSTLGSARVARAARCYSRGHGRRAPPHPMPPRAPRWWRPRQHDHRHRHRHRDCVMSSAVSLARHLCGV